MIMTMLQEPQEPVNIGEMIFHHTGDAHTLDFAPFGEIHLPQNRLDILILDFPQRFTILTGEVTT